MSTSFLRPTAAALGALLTVSGLSACNPTASPPPGDINLRTFQSCNQLRGYAEDAILDYLVRIEYSPMYPEAGGVDNSSNDTNTGSSSGPSDYTTTNVQEAGVDEVDIVKTNGNYIYAVDGQELHIVKSWPAQDSTLVSNLDLGSYAYGMFLYQDTAVVFTWFYNDGTPAPNSTEARMQYGTRVLFVDVSDPTDPQITRTVDFEGYMADGRLIGSDAYLVVNTYLPIPQAAWDLLSDPNIHLPPMNWNASQSEQEQIRAEAHDILRPYVHDIVQGLDDTDLLPLYRDSLSDAADPQPLEQCTDVYEPPNVSQYAMMSIVHLDLANQDLGAAGLMADGWQVYASVDNLYVAQGSWWWWWDYGPLDPSTNIYKFKLTNGDPEYEAAGKVDGWILNQFSMSEYNGDLRVASSKTDWWWGTGTNDGGNSVQVLRDDGHGNLQTIGEVSGIAPGEQITSARFLGAKAYMTTYQWVDPLWTLDLSDPTAPEIAGELQVPGFSTYLHPMDDNHLLTIGYAANTDGSITGMGINVFDVTDLSNPQLTQTYTVNSDDWSWSEALWDHHAFTYHNDVLSLPIYTYDYNDTTGYWDGFSGLLVMHATPDDLTELGRVDHSDMVPESTCSPDSWDGYSCYWYAEMRRSVYIENNLFSISNYGMKVNDLTAPQNEITRVLYHPASTASAP